MAGNTAALGRHTTFARACAQSESGLELFETASERLRRLVQFDGATWCGVDPVTVLPTCPVRLENVESGQCDSYWQREFLVEDVLLFRDLARAPTPAATLYQATDDHPARSARYQEFLAPQGYGDELRAAFRLGGSTWGLLDLFRERGRPPFSPRDLDVMLNVGPMIAAALRALALSGKAEPRTVEGPGIALFDSAGALYSLDEQAEQWFADLAGPLWTMTNTNEQTLLSAVHGVLARAHAIAAGRDHGPASARLRSPSGRWFAMHASCLRTPNGLPGQTAVVIEPAKPAEIVSIIIEAYRLTAREQQITRALARGLSNAEIAAALHLSAHTVRDHLKAIFSKVGVASRGELVAKLFADHYGPALHAPDATVAHVANQAMSR